MQLCNNSNKVKVLENISDLNKEINNFNIGLVGIAHSGKTTLFNHLIGLEKNIYKNKINTILYGNFEYKQKSYSLIDVPSISSLLSADSNEFLSRDFIYFSNLDAIIILCDATNLTDSLNLAIETIEVNYKVILCINFIDEAYKNGVYINYSKIESELGIPVILTCAKYKYGISELLDAIYMISFNDYKFNTKTLYYESNIESVVDSFFHELQHVSNFLNPRWLALRLIDKDENILKSMNIYLDDKNLKSIYNIKNSLPKTLNKEHIRKNFIKTNYNYALQLTNLAYCKDKVQNTNNSDIPNNKKTINIFYKLLIIYFIIKAVKFIL